MDVRPGDKLMMKKQHPCGSKEFLVLRAGMDFKIRCMGCGHEIMVPRLKCEKNIKKNHAGNNRVRAIAQKRCFGISIKMKNLECSYV